MTDVEKALSQIHEIHGHLARTEVYRGLRSLPVAAAGVLGLLAAALQSAFVPIGSSSGFVSYWVAVAVLAFVIAAGGGVMRFLRESEPFQRRRSLHVVGQFVPCLVAGAALTAILERSGDAAIQLLPGLWAILFSLGNFATRPYLPHGIGWVALGYLVAGLILLGLSGSGASLSPWGMGLTFGGGHLAGALVLYWSLERQPQDV